MVVNLMQLPMNEIPEPGGVATPLPSWCSQIATSDAKLINKVIEHL